MWFENLQTEDEVYDAGQLAAWGYKLPDGVTIDSLNRVWLSHCFIVYQGRFFDAECPEGVDTPFSLPLVLNALRKAGLYPVATSSKGEA